ncbi:MAG: hypothetical protein CMA30_05845 [Euryarchaeota archaeon]|nr:hypothetical protein [Euryarchaeota archaeon]
MQLFKIIIQILKIMILRKYFFLRVVNINKISKNEFLQMLLSPLLSFIVHKSLATLNSETLQRVTC